MLGQFLHVFSLNELVDISKIYAKELSRIRGITSANLNTFSNANRTRDPSVMEKFFWIMYDYFRIQDEAFVRDIVWLKKDLMNCLGFYGIAMFQRILSLKRVE